MVGLFAKNAAGITIPTIWTHKWCEIKPHPVRTAGTRRWWWPNWNSNVLGVLPSENSPMPSMEFSLGRKDEGHCAAVVRRGGEQLVPQVTVPVACPTIYEHWHTNWSNSNLFSSGCGCAVLKLTKLEVFNETTVVQWCFCYTMTDLLACLASKFQSASWASRIRKAIETKLGCCSAATRVIILL